MKRLIVVILSFFIYLQTFDRVCILLFLNGSQEVTAAEESAKKSAIHGFSQGCCCGKKQLKRANDKEGETASHDNEEDFDVLYYNLPKPIQIPQIHYATVIRSFGFASEPFQKSKFSRGIYQPPERQLNISDSGYI